MRTLQVPDFAALVPLLNKTPLTDSTDAVAEVELNPIGVKGWADSAQTARSPIISGIASKFALTVALSLMPLAASSFAQAQRPVKTPIVPEHILKFGGNITPIDGGYIQKLRKIVHLDDVIALNGQKNPQSGRIYNVDIPYMARNWDDAFKQNNEGRVLEAIIVAFQHKAGMRYEDGRLGKETEKAIEPLRETASGQAKIAAPTPFTPNSSPQLETTSSPSLDQQLTPQPVQQLAVTPAKSLAVAALPAVPVPLPLHYGKKFYLYTGKLPAISIPDVSNAGISGYVENLNENKTTYEKGDLILTIKNFALESRIAATRAILQDARDLLARLQKAGETQAASENQIEDAQKEVQRLESQLAKDIATEGLGKVTAPGKLTIRDFKSIMARLYAKVHRYSVILMGTGSAWIFIFQPVPIAMILTLRLTGSRSRALPALIGCRPHRRQQLT